jgi:hypothetical protein
VRLPTATYNLPSRNPARLINCYAQQSVGKTPVEVVGTPGIATVTALAGGGRGFAIHDGKLYAVAGTTLYEALTGNGVGTIPGSGKLTFASNASELVTDNGYLFNGSSVSAITDPDKVPWAAVDFCDSYIVAVEQSTGRFVGSAVNDATDWNGLDYATAEGSPDDLVTLKVDHRQVVLFGERSTEVWYASGQDGFTFARLAGGFIEQGCLARLGVTKADHSVFWLADDRTIRRLSGQTAVRVSQHGIEEALSSMTTLHDCEAFSFTWNGHVMVHFRFPTEQRHFVLDVTTGEWHERETDIIDAVIFNGRVYAQHADGSVGRMDDNVYTEFGQNIRREITFPPVYSGQARQFLGQIDFVMRTGDAPANVVPYLTLEVSNDGGNLWHAFSIKELGRTGEYAKVIRWTRLGSGRDMVFRLSTDSPVPFHLVDAQLMAVAGGR